VTRYDDSAKRKTDKKGQKRGKEEQKQEQKRYRAMGAERKRRTKNDAHPRTTEPEEEYSEREKETKSNTDHSYQLVGRRAIILGTRLQEPSEEEEEKERKNNSPQGRAAKNQSKKTT